MTETIDAAQPEALRLADEQEHALLAVANGEIKIGKLPLEPFVRGYAELRRLHAALAAAEARNATLTDDAARWQYAMDGRTKQFAVCEREGMEWTPIKFNFPIDEAMASARAAASITTKGDGHADR